VSGNRTPVARVTGGNTHHYTNTDERDSPNRNYILTSINVRILVCVRKNSCVHINIVLKCHVGTEIELHGNHGEVSCFQEDRSRDLMLPFQVARTFLHPNRILRVRVLAKHFKIEILSVFGLQIMESS
jgi:hypothetical protein